MPFAFSCAHASTVSAIASAPAPRSHARRQTRGALAALAFLLVTAFAPAAQFELTTATIADINQAFAAKALTSEKLVSLYLKRIETYDPVLNAVITLNPKALDEARALDAERLAKGPRSPLHGIPVVLKDNFDTTDLPTTGGFFGLKDSLPPRDATVVAQLRKAGAIILAKVNLSEFASGGATSTFGGRSLNPHDHTRTPAGSSGGTGVALAAVYSPLGYGTDTGGSIRGPSTANGIVGLKPTRGLLSRAGIIPLALSFDTGGPMTRSVYDLAVSLNVTVGADPRDAATAPSVPHLQTDYTKFLKTDALKGARIGFAVAYKGADAEVDTTIESALSALRAAGAEVIEVKIPDAVLKIRSDLYNAIRRPEFKAQIADYLATLPPDTPKNVNDLIKLSEKLTSPSPEGFTPNPARLALFRLEAKTPGLDDPAYLAAVNHGLPFVRDSLQALFTTHRLDAIVYPTSPRRPARIDVELPVTEGSAFDVGSATNLANLSGFPDIIVPAGFTSTGLPIGISFFGPAWSEPKLLGLAYAYEQATRALRLPVSTPALPGESFTY